MSLDSSHTYLHHHTPSHADLLEDFTNPSTGAHLPPDDIYLAPEHQPLNPEDEDDVVPDMHAAFGIQRATQARRQAGWRDLGLVRLMEGVGIGDASGNGNVGAGAAREQAGAGNGGEGQQQAQAQTRPAEVLRTLRKTQVDWACSVYWQVRQVNCSWWASESSLG